MLQKGIDVRDKACYSVAHAKVAQLVEHSTENAGVVGSIPSLGTFYFWQGMLNVAKPLEAVSSGPCTTFHP